MWFSKASHPSCFNQLLKLSNTIGTSIDGYEDNIGPAKVITFHMRFLNKEEHWNIITYQNEHASIYQFFRWSICPYKVKLQNEVGQKEHEHWNHIYPVDVHKYQYGSKRERNDNLQQSGKQRAFETHYGRIDTFTLNGSDGLLEFAKAILFFVALLIQVGQIYYYILGFLIKDLQVAI